MTLNYTKYDPSRTGLIRKQFNTAMQQRFLAIKKLLVDLIYKQNAVGLTANTDWRFLSDPQKLEQFKIWLAYQVDHVVLSKQQSTVWLENYIRQAYTKGVIRSYEDLRKDVKLKNYFKEHPDFYNATRSEFLRSSFARPVALNRVELLAARTYSELKGVTDAMSQQIARVLVDGMAEGQSPRQVASQMAKTVDNIGVHRARMIAQTETIRAHATGQLDSLKNLGVEEVGVDVEFDTAGDNLVCPRCRALQGVVLAVDDAYGIIPVHPFCRCAFIPAIGKPSPTQVRTRSRIIESFKKAGLKQRPRKALVSA